MLAKGGAGVTDERRKPCPNCFGAGCFVCLPEFATDEPGENDPELEESEGNNGD